jgi:hypothetical protein
MGQPEYIDHGDAEAAVVDILKNFTPELVFSSGQPNISTNMIGYVLGDRRIVVSQEGSFEEWPVLDHPRIDFEVYAERRSVARDIASICMASVKYQMGRYRGNGLFLSDVKVEQGLTRTPDKYQESVRYVFGLRLTTRPSGFLASPS